MSRNGSSRPSIVARAPAPSPGPRADDRPPPRAPGRGYVDCLMAHQHGFREAVAVLGTALTPPSAGTPSPLRRRGDPLLRRRPGGAEAARRAEDLLERSADPQWWRSPGAPDRSRAAASGSAWRRSRPATTPTRSSAEGPEALEACLPRRPAAAPLRARPGRREEDTASPRGRATGSARVALLLSKVQDGDEAIELGRRRPGGSAWIRATSGSRPSGWPSASARPRRRRDRGPRRRAARGRDLVRARPLQLLLQAPEARAGAAAADRAPASCPPEPGPSWRRSRTSPRPRRRRSSRAWPGDHADAPHPVARRGARVARSRRRGGRAPAPPERRQAQRRVREISQTVAQSEASGATTDFNSLHTAIGQETPRIRADAGAAREPWFARTSRRRTHVHERRPQAGRAGQAHLDGQAEGLRDLRRGERRPARETCLLVPARRHHGDVRGHGHRRRRLRQGGPPPERDRGHLDEREEPAQAEPGERSTSRRAHRPHRGPGADVPPRDGPRLAPHPGGRDRARQADRGRQGGRHPGGHVDESSPSASSRRCGRGSARPRISVRDMVDISDEELHGGEGARARPRRAGRPRPGGAAAPRDPDRSSTSSARSRDAASPSGRRPTWPCGSSRRSSSPRSARCRSTPP